MSWSCLLHGHEIIRYDRELAWECIRCLKKWPMGKELVSSSGVFARRTFAAVKTTTQPAVTHIHEFRQPKGRRLLDPPRVA